MAADVGDLLALVDVHTGPASVLEAWLADAAVGAGIVLALRVYTAHKPVQCFQPLLSKIVQTRYK